jgi:hypothetical protein
VVYSSNNVGHSLRGQLAMVLGIWHPYKVANDKLFLAFLHTFWAPAIHAIAKDSKIFRSQSLRRLATFFTQCRLAYPAFKPELDRIVRSRTELERFPAEMRNHLLNLHHAFSFFIPAVMPTSALDSSSEDIF